MSLEAERREEVRGEVGQHAGVLVGDQRDARHTRRDRGREPRREVRERLHTDVGHVGRLEALQRSGDDGVLTRRGNAAEGAELFTERAALGRVDSVRDGAEGGPEGVHADVLVEVAGIVERDALEALEVRRDLIKLGEAAAALLLDAHLDLADPAALELDALRDDLRLQTGGVGVNTAKRWTEKLLYVPLVDDLALGLKLLLELLPVVVDHLRALLLEELAEALLLAVELVLRLHLEL